MFDTVHWNKLNLKVFMLWIYITLFFIILLDVLSLNLKMMWVVYLWWAWMCACSPVFKVLDLLALLLQLEFCYFHIRFLVWTNDTGSSLLIPKKICDAYQRCRVLSIRRGLSLTPKSSDTICFDMSVIQKFSL